MATTNLAMQKYKNRRNKGAAKMSAAPKTQQEKLQDQIKNYQTRLQTAGVNPEEATDTRNWFEKLTNLPEKQNALFDIFELINRPQQALFTGINNAIQGDDFLEGLKEGISGETETSGGEILRNLGMSGSGEFNLFDPSSYGEASLSDFLGFGLDIFADPLDWALIPVTGGANIVAGSAVDAAKAADTVADAAKVAKVADTASDVAKASKEFKSVNELLFGAAGKGAKALAGKGDDIIEKFLTKSDAKSLAKAQEYVAKNKGSIENALKQLGRSNTKLDTYKGIKKEISKGLNSAKNLGGLIGKGKEASNLSEVEKQVGQEMINKFSVDVDDIAKDFKKLGFESKDEATKKIWDNLSYAIENNRDWTLTGKNVIDRLTENKAVYMHSKFNAEKVAEALKEYGIKTEIDGDKLKLLSSKNKLYAIQDAFNNKLFGSKVSDAAQKTMDDATDFFKQNDKLQALYTKARNADSQFARFSDTLKGTNLSNITTDDYIRHTLNENVSPSEAKAFSARKYDAPIAEVNEMKRLEKQASINKLAEQNKKIKESIYTLNEKGDVVRNQNYVDEIAKTHQANIDRLNKSIDSQKELMKGAYDETGKKIPFDTSKVDVAKLNKKDTKLYNRIVQDKELREVTENLKKIKFEDINPVNTQAVDNLRSTYKNYTKAVTNYKNELIKKSADEDTIKKLKDIVDINKKQVTAQIKAVEALSNKQSRQVINRANKAYKEGKSLGAEIEKSMSKLKTSNAKTKEVLDSLVENVDSLNGKLNFEQESLNKLLANKDKVSDEIFNKKLKTIEDNAKAISTLSDEATQDFFKTRFDETFMDFVNRSSAYTEGANKLNEALTVGIFDNPEYIKKAADLTNNKIPYNFEKISGSYLKNKMLSYKSMLSDEGKKLLDNAITSIGDDAIYLDKDLAKYLKVSSNAVSKEINPLLKMWDGMNNVFKKFSTLTTGFQTRNIIGNTTNMVLSGASAKELPKYYAEAGKIWNNADDLLKKAASNTLEGAEKAQWDTLQEFYKAGFLNAFEKGQGLESIKNAKGILGKASQLSVNANTKVDTYNRLALLLYAKDHPEYVSKLGRKNAVDTIKMVLFDPSNMSDIEKNVMKRIIPFYTFTKQNLMFQAENVMKNTPRYNKLFKSLRKAYDAVGEDSYYQYQKEAMQIPLPFKDDEGNQLFLKSNLPVSDLGEYLSSPLGRTVASMTPIIKAPVEMRTGKSLFTGDDTNYKTLSNTLNKLGVRSQGIENAAQAAETILSNFGLQNISTNLIKKVTAIIDRNNDNISDQQLWAEIFRSVIQNTKRENVINSGLYDQLEAYQAIVKRLKNQGVDVPTMTQINQVNKMKLNKMKNKRAQLR